MIQCLEFVDSVCTGSLGSSEANWRMSEEGRGGARKDEGWEREARSSWFLSSRVERKNLLGVLAE